MKRIYKYPLALADGETLSLPEGAQVLAVQAQNNFPMLWALVDPEAIKRPFHVRTYGTGHRIDDPELPYLGTFQIQNGVLVFHVFGGFLP